MRAPETPIDARWALLRDARSDLLQTALTEK
jgi:hypothetical protein